MADFEIFGPYAVAFLMSIGAVCVFVWGVLDGAMTDTDQAALNFYHAEMANDRLTGDDDPSLG